ncbi:hypothetical protein OG21DRAFT_1491513 [Imleria badia]|nr:hypothetical protein OG21DRAFT_1491513 [Imleria badia]
MAGMQIAPIAGTGGQAGEQSVEEEFASYTTTISNSDTDVFAFWENDLGIPPYSKWRWIICPFSPPPFRRNRINPTFMEALQMTKFSINQGRLNFAWHWATSEKELVRDDGTEDTLAQLASGAKADVDAAMAHVIDMQKGG